MRSGSSTGARARRSSGPTSGKVQYIMTIPDTNHSRKMTESATPSQRWTKISVRLSSVAGPRTSILRLSPEPSTGTGLGNTR